MRRIGFRKMYSGRFILALWALLAVIGIGSAALAASLPTSGTCRMLVVKSAPPPGSNIIEPVSMIISITFGSTPTVSANIVKITWGGGITPTITEGYGTATGVSIVDNSGSKASGFYLLTGTVGTNSLSANLVPVNSGNTTFVQMTSPEPLSGVCQME